MIKSLSIKNVILIESLEIIFDKRLNILSGETGAGKSIIFDAINFLAGSKVNKGFIKQGCDKAEVSARVHIKDSEEDYDYIIYRSLHRTGRNVCKVNDKIVKLAYVKELAADLFDIHNQNSNYALFLTKNHINVLDDFCSKSVVAYKRELKALIEKYKDILKKLAHFRELAETAKDKRDMLSHQLKEIEEADLKEEEEDMLLEQKHVLLNTEKMRNVVSDVNNLLYYDDLSAYERISKSVSLLSNAKVYADIDETALDNLNNAIVLIDDSLKMIKDYEQDDNDFFKMDNIEKRLDVIYSLKRKYGASIEDIVNYKNDIYTKIVELDTKEDCIKRLNDEKIKVKRSIVLLCESLSKVRQDVANSIKADVELFLKSLGMTKVRFDISVEKKDKFSEQGYDDVVFLIATNTDKELTSLANVASGGETSRVMLAIKAVLAKAARHKTFIFDEIDTGVSGMAAQKVAESLVRFSATNQILCITHLPQIAAMADNHFKIVKIYEQNKTITTINLLDKYECVLELARLTSGVKITESTMAAANDLKETAIELKEHIRV